MQLHISTKINYNICSIKTLNEVGLTFEISLNCLAIRYVKFTNTAKLLIFITHLVTTYRFFRPSSFHAHSLCYCDCSNTSRLCDYNVTPFSLFDTVIEYKLWYLCCFTTASLSLNHCYIMVANCFQDLP